MSAIGNIQVKQEPTTASSEPAATPMEAETSENSQDSELENR